MFRAGSISWGQRGTTQRKTILGKVSWAVCSLLEENEEAGRKDSVVGSLSALPGRGVELHERRRVNGSEVLTRKS